MNTDSTYAKSDRTQRAGPRLVAVIDIGASSLRMQIAEIHDDDRIVRLESFEQAVSLGKDSFIKGRIDKSTIEDCVHVLSIYRAKLDEYGISDPGQIRVIGTSGLREAANRMAFQDRIFIATGFEIEPFDEAELHERKKMIAVVISPKTRDVVLKYPWQDVYVADEPNEQAMIGKISQISLA